MGAISTRSSKVQLGHGIMSGAASLARTNLAIPTSIPPSLGQGEENGRSVGRGVRACCDLRMHCAHLHGCAHVAAALATQKEQAVCDVIAYQGYPQALIQHQAGMVLLGGCKASQEPLSCKLASILALTFALHKLTRTRPFAAMV